MANMKIIIFNSWICLVFATTKTAEDRNDLSDTPSNYATTAQLNTLQILLNQETLARAELQGDVLKLNTKVKDMANTLSTLKSGYDELKEQMLQERTNFNATIEKLKADLAQENRSCEQIKHDIELFSLKCGLLEDQIRNVSASADSRMLQFDTNVSKIENRLKVAELETLDSKQKVLNNERILNDSVTHIQNITSDIKVLKAEYRNLDGLQRASVLRQISFNGTLNTLQNKMFVDDGNITEHIMRLHNKIENLTNYQANISTLLYDFHTDIMETIKNVSHNNVQPPVVFMAYQSTLTRQMSEFQTVTFDHMDINLGGAYNKDSSIFISPYNGIYSFTLTITTTGLGGPISHIVRNGNGIAWLYGSSDGASSTRQASTSVSVLLSAGDKVWIRWHGSQNTKLVGWPETYFSGHLVAKT